VLDEVIDDEMDAMLVALLLVCLFHITNIPQVRPPGNGQGLLAHAEERLTAGVETPRLAAA
jgi:hypothetical protein